MEVMFALPLIILPFIIPLITGLMAKNFGRKFWPWFWIGVPLPLIGCIILLALPDKSIKENEYDDPGSFYDDEQPGNRVAV